MTFPDDVTVLRATAADEYGNPGASWTTPTETAAKAFVNGAGGRALLPPGTDVKAGDRLRWQGRVYSVEEAFTVRSPSRDVLVKAALRRVEG